MGDVEPARSLNWHDEAPAGSLRAGQANGRTGQLTLLGYLGPNAGVVLFSAVVLANFQPLLDAPLSRR